MPERFFEKWQHRFADAWAILAGQAYACYYSAGYNPYTPDGAPLNPYTPDMPGHRMTNAPTIDEVPSCGSENDWRKGRT
jgi:hypothetical protein